MYKKRGTRFCLDTRHEDDKCVYTELTEKCKNTKFSYLVTFSTLFPPRYSYFLPLLLLRKRYFTNE